MELEQYLKNAFQDVCADLLGNIMNSDMEDILKQTAKLEFLRKKPLLSSADVANLYGIPTATLATWRSRGMGPDYTKAEGSVFYTHQQIERWIAKNEVRHEK